MSTFDTSLWYETFCTQYNTYCLLYDIDNYGVDHQLRTLHSHIGFWINYNLLSYGMCVGKTNGKTQFFISYKNTQRNIDGFTSFMWDSMQHLSFRNKEWKSVPWCNEIQNKWRLDLRCLSIFTPIPQCAQDVWPLNQFYM